MARAGKSKRTAGFLDPAVLQKIGPLDLIAKQVVEGARVGMHRSPLRGFSTTFAQHRQYVPGDEIKHIDWRVYARAQRYYIKLYEAETTFTANLLLDASSSMTYGSKGVSKLDYARMLAASLAYLIVDQRDDAGLAVFTDKLDHYVEPKSSFAVVRDMDAVLQDVKHAPRTNIAAILHDFARRMARRGFVLLFSDLFDHFDEFMSGLNHLRFGGHNVIVFHLMDQAELEFTFAGTWQFEGLEGEEPLLTQPNRIRTAYLEEVRKFLTQIKGACERGGIDYVLVNTARPVAETLSGFLIDRIYGPVRA